MGIPSVGAHLEDSTTTANTTYVGEAKRKNALTSAAVWKIFKMTYDGSGNLLSVKWGGSAIGGGTELYNNIWDNRATTVIYT